MSLPRNLINMYGQPVGVSFQNGQGTSGILCGVQDNELMLIEYMYQENFALKKYPVDEISDVLAFPRCRSIPRQRQNRLY